MQKNRSPAAQTRQADYFTALFSAFTASNMKHTYSKSDFFFSLPDEQIARFPLPERSASRLLVADVENENTIHLCDSQVKDFVQFLNAGDLLIFNNTRVLPARLFGQKASGGRVEIMIERLKSPQQARAYLRASKTPKVGAALFVGKNGHSNEITVTGRSEALFTLESAKPWQELLAEAGEMPLPPYLARAPQESDKARYQTIYAKNAGAVAAPTAGLHFDEKLLQAIDEKGVLREEITLHVGAGTFQPVRHEDLNAHVMHEEWFSLSDQVVSAVKACKARGGRVIAIGTTSLRALESAAQSGELQPFQGDTDIFITPNYDFRCVDALFTNFHLPESTLLMLVSAFAGVENIRRAYAHAIAHGYRFYSYGDAMFLPRRLAL